jgi:hypothetical protein
MMAFVFFVCPPEDISRWISLLTLLGGAASSRIWWKYVVPASDVFMDEANLYADRGSKRSTVPLASLVRVRRPWFLRKRPFIVTFETTEGKTGEFLFYPSLNASGFSIDENRVGEILAARAKENLEMRCQHKPK